MTVLNAVHFEIVITVVALYFTNECDAFGKPPEVDKNPSCIGDLAILHGFMPMRPLTASMCRRRVALLLMLTVHIRRKLASCG